MVTTNGFGGTKLELWASEGAGVMHVHTHTQTHTHTHARTRTHTESHCRPLVTDRMLQVEGPWESFPFYDIPQPFADTSLVFAYAPKIHLHLSRDPDDIVVTCAPRVWGRRTASLQGRRDSGAVEEENERDLGARARVCAGT